MELRKPLGLLAALATFPALAGPAPSFAGLWSIDLHPPGQVSADGPCGRAQLELRQEGRHIRGHYQQASADCTSLEKGAEVSGEAWGTGATLEIRSSRNGTVVRGRAVVKGDKLYWQARNIVVRGRPEGDDNILRRGILSRGVAPAGSSGSPALSSAGSPPATVGLPRP